jgi:hypothetical protein
MTALLEYYNSLQDTDKTDKGTYHNYIQEYYTNIFSDIRNESLKILEIGVLDGKSMKFWNDWFTSAEIIGVDINQQSKPFIDANGYKVIWGDAYNQTFTELFQNSYFDFIIDDGPHTLDSQLYTATNYFEKLKINGLLIIEDIFDFNFVDEIQNHVKTILPHDSYEFKCFDFRKSKNRFDDVIIEIKRLK